MPECKRRAANALPLKRGGDEVRQGKLELNELREKLQKSVIDNPKTAKKAALLVSLWIAGEPKFRKKAG